MKKPLDIFVVTYYWKSDFEDVQRQLISRGAVFVSDPISVPFFDMDGARVGTQNAVVYFHTEPIGVEVKT